MICSGGTYHMSRAWWPLCRKLKQKSTWLVVRDVDTEVLTVVVRRRIMTVDAPDQNQNVILQEQQVYVASRIFLSCKRMVSVLLAFEWYYTLANALECVLYELSTER